ncbi:MAG TPA: ferredoxin [Nitrospirota bacterium]|nr:ferredoxin [Nitrospirota bacterium]
MAKKHKVTIDREECTSCETCWITCPDFFEQNPSDNWSQVVAKYRVGGNPAEGESPAELEDKVQEAADSCPVSIIHVEG